MEIAAGDPWRRIFDTTSVGLEIYDSHKDKIHTLWQIMIEKYSGRKFTNSQDKLPAFSGLASRMQIVIGGYIAGLWREKIMNDLV